MPEPHLRAADADRTAVATVLGEHMAAGRLTVDEYEDRLARAYAARTYGELGELTADLPARTAAPVPGPRDTAPARGDGCSWDGAHSWRSWLTTSLIVLIIWAAMSLANRELLDFWPVWVIGPWGAVLLVRKLTGGKDEAPEERRRLGC
jgi:hypothetical protein